MKKIKAVLIDIDNTLLDFNACAEQSMLSAGKEMGIPLPHNVMETFLPINNRLWAKIEKGELDLDGLHKVRWNTVFEALKVKGDGPSFEKVFKRNLYYSACPVEGAVDICKYLSSRYKLYSASNGPYDQQEYRLKKAGLLPYMTDIFVSERAEASKPSPLFFDYCFGRMDGILPSEAIMIGDSTSADIKGAKDYGLLTCWFDYYKTGEVSPLCDYKILSLTDIKNIL